VRATKVLIGIPTLNGPDRLNRLLFSIRHHTDWSKLGPCKLLVCDDGSREPAFHENRVVCGEYGDLRDKAGLEYIAHNARRGIAAGWNTLCRHGHADWDVAVLLNDDVEVVRHWLEATVYSLVRNPALGMVGLNAYLSVTKGQVDMLHPGALEHVRHLQIDYHEAKLESANGTLLASHGSAFGFRKDAYEKVGGFDERYFCFYEELDFGVSARTHGLVHAMLRYPIIYHMGGATNSLPSNLDARARMDESRRKFEDKWGGSPNALRERLAPQSFVWNEWNTQIANWY